jgi:NAD(P)-dependent dehydrogenase (short-subunit alcohol dehydrogenase family)
MNLIDLSGKTIVITGASSGIGREVASIISRLGGHGVLIARREDELKKTADQMCGSPAIYSFDLQHTENIESLVRQILKEQGPVDGLVHCAGIQTTVALRAITIPMLEKTMRIHFYGFLELAKHFTAPDTFRPGISLVGISSVAAVQGKTGQTIYSASKAALEAAIRCLAAELAPKGVRANCVAPAIIRTEFIDRLLELSADSENVRSLLARQYLGIGEPADVAAMVAFLLSDASKFITGATLPVDGGRLSS